MKVFIIMCNRLTWPKQMCEWIVNTGHTPILVDNNSTYKPLLDWYNKECPYIVHRMDKNWGHLVLWASGLINSYNDEYYCVTDHDLDLSLIPNDWEYILKRGLELYPNMSKSGFSLELTDLPENLFTEEVVRWESKFWKDRDKHGYYHSNIDTTFAMYDRKRDFGLLPPEGNKFHWAVRAPRPYTARHLPWYLTKEFIENNEEERYYQNNTHTYWSQKFKELL